jgi:hypothetical protein
VQATDGGGARLAETQQTTVNNLTGALGGRQEHRRWVGAEQRDQVARHLDRAAGPRRRRQVVAQGEPSPPLLDRDARASGRVHVEEGVDDDPAATRTITVTTGGGIHRSGAP